MKEIMGPNGGERNHGCPMGVNEIMGSNGVKNHGVKETMGSNRDEKKTLRPMGVNEIMVVQ